MLTQYLYCCDNPIKFIDETGQYYIKQIKERNKPTQYLAVKQSLFAVIGLSAVEAFDPTGGLSKIFVAFGERLLNYVGGNSLTNITLADTTWSILGNQVENYIEEVLETVAAAAVPFAKALFMVKDFLVEFDAHYDVTKTDAIVFKLLDLCNREIKSTDIIEVVERMGYAYKFVEDFGWYFYGRVWTQKSINFTAMGGYYYSYIYGDTYWEMDLRINSPGRRHSFQSRIDDYIQEYYNVLICHYNYTRMFQSGAGTAAAWARVYTDSLSKYLVDWYDRLEFIKKAFLAYIDQ